MSEVQGKAVDLNLLRRVMTFIRPYKVIFALTLVLTILLGFLAPIRPVLIQHAIDDHILIDLDQVSNTLSDVFQGDASHYYQLIEPHFETTRNEGLLYLIIVIISISGLLL